MNKQFVMLIGIMLLFSFAFVTSAGLEQVGDLKDEGLSADRFKPNYCYNADFKIVECSGLIKAGETEIKREEKLLIKTDAVYLIGVDAKETKLEDKKGSSIYIHKKASGETYHVDNLNDIPVETYLDFYYTKQPNVITHVNKYGEKVKDFQVWEYQWTPKTCKGSGEDMVCSKDGTARIFTTLTENSVGSETFPLTFTPAQWKTDNQGYASFDGVDDYVEVANSNILNPGTNDFTISIWAKSDDVTVTQAVAQKKGDIGSPTQPGWGILIISDKWRMTISNGTTAYGNENTGSLNDDTWTLFTMKREGTKFYRYINGVAHDNGLDIPADYNISNLARTFQLGIDSTGRFLNGSLDNVQVFNKSLNTTEISQLYNYGRQKKGICNLITDGQVACYDFDDNSFGDGSGNGNYGTPMGFSDTTPEVNDVTTLNSGDYSLTSSGLLTIIDDTFKLRLLKVDYSWLFRTSTATNTASINVTAALSTGSLWISIFIVVLFAVVVFELLADGLNKSVNEETEYY